MCQHFTTLAMSNNYRQIMRCEHGTIHLSWDLITIYLDDKTFAVLTETLDKAAALFKPGKVQHNCCHIFHREPGYFQIWVRNVALNLSPADFKIFGDLVRAAGVELSIITSRSEVEKRFERLPKRFHRMVKASAINRFSLN